MRCEVCGRKIHGNPYRVAIEGAKLTVCGECSKHGTTIWEEEPKPKTITPKLRAPSLPLRTQSKKQKETTLETPLEITENFDVKIRQAREKLKLSHEDLGKKLNEKVSLLRKIETRKMTPDNKLAMKLEHALKIKLLVQTKEEKIPEAKIPKPSSRELTLGDLIKLNNKSKKKKEEETTKREPS